MAGGWIQAKIQWGGLRTLIREIGFRRALVWGVPAQIARNPLRELGPPVDRKDKETRGQFLPALRIYNQLSKRLGKEEALRITGLLVHGGALIFLGHTLGGMDVEGYRHAPLAERERYIRSFVDRFPNATSRIENLGDSSFTQVVVSCRFVTLCEQVGAPELAPLFCAADLAYFVEGPIRLERPKTLAGGDDCCEFRFTLHGEIGE